MNKLHQLFSLVVAASLLLAGCAPQAVVENCADQEVFCVALVTDVGKVNDNAFNQAAWEAVKEIEREFQATVKYIETVEPQDYEKNIAVFGDASYDVIVTVGFGMREATIAAADLYPDTLFIGVDQPQEEIVPNLAGLIFPEDQAGFLVGALAAQMTKTNKIGAVLSSDNFPEFWRLGEGYRAGALYVNPAIEVNVVYHNEVGFEKTFTDPEWGAATARSQVSSGADVIFGAGFRTGNGAVIGAVQAGAMAIGVDVDQYYTLPEAQKKILSSAVKMIAPGVFDLVRAAKEGTFAGGNFIGKSGYAPFHELEDKVPDAVQEKMIKIQQMLESGELKTNVLPSKP